MELEYCRLKRLRVIVRLIITVISLYIAVMVLIDYQIPYKFVNFFVFIYFAFTQSKTKVYARRWLSDLPPAGMPGTHKKRRLYQEQPPFLIYEKP
jgi:hypothetical protein